MRLSIVILLLCAFFSSTVFAQKSPSKFGDIDIENLKMTTPPIDSTAGAVVLFDFGFATYDHNFEISLECHTRIKIFNSTEFDRGDIKIPYAEGDRVEKLKASSYNLENGKIVESEVSKRDMFDEDVRDGLKQKRFSIPNVKEGTIIEYTYRVNYGGWQSLSSWYFQQSIPVLYSEYVVKLPEYFTYKQLMTGYITLANVERSVENGYFNGSNFNVNVEKYVATNVPAFKDEPYMTTNENYIAKIKYELSNISIPGQMYQTRMASSYMALSKKIAEDDYYGKSLDNNKYLHDVIDEVTANKASDIDKIKALYEYVRDNYEIDYDVEAESLRRILALKKGYAADLNRMLTSLLRESGYNAHIVKLSTRSHGLLHPIYAARSNFNWVITCATLNDKDILMDASAKDTPFEMLPEKCLNGRGLLISESPRWVDLTPSKTDNTMIFGNLEIDDEGLLNGMIQVSLKDYGAADFRSDNKDDIDKYLTEFAEKRGNWTFDKHEVNGLKDVESPIKEDMQVHIEGQVEDVGNIMYLNPLVYGKTDENPFKTEQRLFPVDFGMPISETINYRIKLPEGYSVDEIPEPLAIGLPNQAGTFIYQVKVMGEYLSIVSKLDIKKTVFGAEEYPYLREFFTQVTAKQGEQIVLKEL